MNNSKQTKLLVVDDSDTNRLLLQFTLDELGYQVDEAVDGEKAVEKAIENDYAAIIMDINMPVMSGPEAAKMLLNLNYESPIIACSAEDDQLTINKYLDEGFSGFIAKPIEPINVINLLKKLSIGPSTEDKFNSPEHQKKLEQLGERFRGNLPAIISKLQRAMELQSFEELQKICHKLKGSASQFGYERVTRISDDLERAIKKGKTQVAIDKTTSLVLELKRIENELQ